MSRLTPRTSDADELVAGLRADKEALKSALRAAVAQRDELLDRAKRESAVGARRDGDALRRENADLLRKLEDQRKKHQRVLSSLEDHNRDLEESVRKLQKQQKSKEINLLFPERPSLELLKYTQVLLDKSHESPDALRLLAGRIPSARRFLADVEDGQFHDCLLRTLQFASDLLDCQVRREACEGRVTKESKAMQTSTETGTNTTPQRSRTREEAAGDSSRRSQSDVPVFLMNTTASSGTEGFVSPTSVRSVFSPKAEDEYTRLMDESEQLLSTLHFQNDRLLRLNSQIHQTMKGAQLRTARWEDSSETPPRRPSLHREDALQLSPPLETVRESLHRDELSTEKELPEANSDIEASFSPKADQVVPAPQVGSHIPKPRTAKKATRPNSSKGEERPISSLKQEENPPATDFFGQRTGNNAEKSQNRSKKTHLREKSSRI